MLIILGGIKKGYLTGTGNYTFLLNNLDVLKKNDSFCI